MSEQSIVIEQEQGLEPNPNDEIYVQRLMRARCTCGSMDNYLNIAVDHGVLTGEDQQPLMNANDHIAGENVIHFGNCNSDNNPERVFRKGLVGGLLGGPLLGSLVSDFLEDTGIMSFKCTPKTDEVWEETNENNIIEGAPALLMKSCLTCRYGGVITIVQEEASEADAQDGEGEDTSEEKEVDTVQAETDAVLAAAMERISAARAPQESAEAEAQVSMVAATATTATAAEAAISSYCKGGMAPSGVNEKAWAKPIECSPARSRENFEHNKAVPFEGPFLDNNKMIVDHTQMGDFRINNFTVDKVGGGAVAAYNAYQLLQPNNAPSFVDVIQSMEPYGLLNNPYGIMPCGIADQFIRAGFDVGYEVTDIGEKIKEASAGILGIATQECTHFVTCKPLGGGELQFFNMPDGLDKNVRTFSDLTTQMEGRSAFAFMGMTISEKKGGKKVKDIGG